jgi:2-C-methyl-D-erythritol 4-phosphate cytidylyltransferase
MLNSIVTAKKKENETTGAIVVAAGAGKRFGKSDKILAPLAGKPILARVLEPFIRTHAIDRIVVVCNRRNLAAIKTLLSERGWDDRVTTCLGGERRQDSVFAGFRKLGRCDWVVIQDAARPLITPDLIRRGLEAARETGAAVAGVPTIDTVKIVDSEGVARWTLPRDRLWNVQTPQVFRCDVLARAFEYIEHDVTDEAQLVELTGGRVKTYTGAYDNMKITTPADLEIAAALLRRRGKK